MSQELAHLLNQNRLRAAATAERLHHVTLLTLFFRFCTLTKRALSYIMDNVKVLLRGSDLLKLCAFAVQFEFAQLYSVAVQWSRCTMAFCWCEFAPFPKAAIRTLIHSCTSAV